MNRHELERRYKMLRMKLQLEEFLTQTGIKTFNYESTPVSGSKNIRKGEDLVVRREKAIRRLSWLGQQLCNTAGEIDAMSRKIASRGMSGNASDALIFRLTYMEGYSIVETATLLGSPFDSNPKLIAAALERCYHLLWTEDPC